MENIKSREREGEGEGGEEGREEEEARGEGGEEGVLIMAEGCTARAEAKVREVSYGVHRKSIMMQYDLESGNAC